MLFVIPSLLYPVCSFRGVILLTAELCGDVRKYVYCIYTIARLQRTSPPMSTVILHAWVLCLFVWVCVSVGECRYRAVKQMTDRYRLVWMWILYKIFTIHWTIFHVQYTAVSRKKILFKVHDIILEKNKNLVFSRFILWYLLI